MRFCLLSASRQNAVRFLSFVLAFIAPLAVTSAIAADSTPASAPAPQIQSASTAVEQQHIPTQKPRRIVPPRPDYRLDDNDRLAALRAIQIALSSVGDGGAYLWERHNGRINGVIRPTKSFHSSAGDVCRHMIVRLTSKRFTRQVEGIACQNKAGVWTLSG